MTEVSRAILESVLRALYKDYELSWDEIRQLLTPLEVPVSIFKGPHTPMEAASLYLLDACNLDAKEIGEILGRTTQAVNTAAREGRNKGRLDISGEEKVPVSDLGLDKSVLVSIVNYLNAKKGMRPSEIAEVLGRSRSSVSYLLKAR